MPGCRRSRSLLAQRDAARRDTENLEIAFAIGAGVLTLGILLIAAALLVRNNVSLARPERARANEAAILQATLETVREGIAYFTTEGLLCAFNASFFRLLDLPDALADLQQTRLADLRGSRRRAPSPTRSSRRQRRADRQRHPAHRLGRPRAGHLQGRRSPPAAS